MSKFYADLFSYFLIFATIVCAILLYADLPPHIPTHWNAAGEVDGYTSKFWGILILVLAPVFAMLLLKIIPAISPRGFRTESFSEVVNIFQLTLVGFAAAVAILVMLEARGFDVRINQMIYIGVGLLFFILGYYLGRVRKNFFLGIRTPWTLASDEVWNRTHRIGGRLFMLGGLIMMSAAFVPIATGMLVGVILAVALFPVIWSYVLYRRIEGFSPDDEPLDD